MMASSLPADRKVGMGGTGKGGYNHWYAGTQLVHTIGAATLPGMSALISPTATLGKPLEIVGVNLAAPLSVAKWSKLRRAS
jgi:hypothetical protein